MIRVDSDMDIAEDEPMPGVGTGHTMKEELDGVTTRPKSAPDPHNNTVDSVTPAQSSVAHAQDWGAKDGQGHLNSQLTLNDYEEIMGSVKSDPTQ